MPAAYSWSRRRTGSWRYADAAQTVEVTEDGASAVFDGDAVRDQWLSGSSDAVCNRKG